MTKSAFAAECKRRRNAELILVGNTFSIKDQVKAVGGIWDDREQAWLMPDDASINAMLDLMNALEDAGTIAPPAPITAHRAPAARRRVPSTRGRCTECGEWGAKARTCQNCHEGTHV